MKKSTLLITLLSGLLLLTAGTEARTMRAQWAAATPASYPEADLVVLDDTTRIRYEADGTYRYNGEVALKILTEKGRQKKSAISMGFDAAYGVVRFVRAELIKPNGGVVPIDLETQLSETIAAGQMSANIYDPNHKQLTLSIPHLEIGDVLRYSYAGERTKTVVPDSWSDWFVLEESAPIVRAVYEVNAPAALPLARISFRDEIPGTVYSTEENRDDRILYRWEVCDVPRLFAEPKMPASHTVAQRVLLSTLSDWEGLSKWYWELSKPRLEAVTPGMKAKVRELTAGLTGRQEKIEALFRFVSQEIRYMGITIEDEAPGYEPHDVSLTFDNRYGVCRDKAALLVTLLRMAGFEAYPVLIYVGPKKDPDVPQPWFNHAITAVRNEDGSDQLMDSTNENTRDLLPAYLSDCSYLVAHPNGETLQTSPVISPEENLLTIEVDAVLEDENQITGEAVLSFAGINDTAYRGRLARLKPEEREPYFEERLKQALGNATLTRLRITPAEVRDTSVPLSVTMGFEISNPLVAGAKESLLKVPTLINRFGLFGALLGDGIGLDQRRFPLKTGVTCGVSETVRLDLRKSSLRPTALPDYQTVDTPELLLQRSMESTNGRLVSRANLMLRTVEFTPEQYLELKQALKTGEQNARKRVILSTGHFPLAADLATLEETVTYSVFDENNWKKEHTLRRKVLTYAGKRAASDLKIHYNPSFELCMLDAATIYAPDGSVRQIDPEKEINLMDARWAGDAPRYPAEKILVASLPGVEIGSVIETKTTTLYRDRPFFSATEHFADHNPIISKTVRLRTPHRMKFKHHHTAPGVISRRTHHEGDLAVHEWRVENQEMIKKEDHLPPRWILTPTLFLSGGTVNGYAKTVEEALLKAAKQDDTAKEKARELTQGIKNPLEKMTILRDFVDRTIRRAGPGLSALPLSAITPADQILSEGYGNTTDRAVLLYALCKAVKLKPRFVLSSHLPRAKALALPETIPFQEKPYDTLLVAIHHDKEVYYLGDSGQYAQLGTLAHDSQPAIHLGTHEPEIPQSRIVDSTETTFHIDLAENGHVDLIQRTIFHGTDYEAFHKQFAEFTPEERRREMQKLLSRLSQSAQAAGELRTDLGYPGKLEFAARIDSYAVRDGEHLYLTLPGGLGNLLQLKSSSRDSMFHLKEPLNRTFVYEITLPADWQPVLMPEPFRVELPGEAGTLEFLTMKRRNKLVVVQRAELNPALIGVEDYKELLEINNRLTQPAARTLLLRKNQ